VPVAVLDSGLGGVAVLRELVVIAPRGDFLYLADHAGHPYGDREPADIAGRIAELAAAGIAMGATGLVVACNTATAVAVDALRAARPDVPVVGIEPPVKPAAAMTASGVIGVLATPPTASSDRVARLVEMHAEGVRVLVQPCAGLADAIEAGDLAGPGVGDLLDRYVAPLVAAGADVLALGCTHYSFVRERIRLVAGGAVTVVDPCAAVARRALTVIDGIDVGAGAVRWFSTDPGDADGLSRAWGTPLRVDALP
jgi:glutamate racemase